MPLKLQESKNEIHQDLKIPLDSADPLCNTNPWN